MYRLITCDLDETLLTSDKKVPQANRDAIAKAQEMGVHFVPATGRGFASIQHTLEELGMKNAKNTYTISFNGGVITENYQNTIIEETRMDFGHVDQLFQIGLEKDVCIHVYTHEDVFIFRINEEEAGYLAKTMPYKEITAPSIAFLKDTPLIKILFQNLDRGYLTEIHEALPDDLRQKTDISYSSNRYLEFNPIGVNKGAALLNLAKHLGIPQEETIAIGDNLNDLSMILTASLGVAVANAVPDVKEQADYVTEADHNEGAVGEVMEKFVF